ncbi:MAG TPA: hypothetical protein EYP03_03795, partial [Aquificae bacterium]|nr:hypothetical protein [Aquificota bacterium]
ASLKELGDSNMITQQKEAMINKDAPNPSVEAILHDFNTPISSLLLNAKTLPKTKESYDKISRIESRSEQQQHQQQLLED